MVDFPTDDVCLNYIFKRKYPALKGYYRISTRKAYSNSKGKQIYPLKGTIFEKSDTKLTSWFFAIYLFASSKNGVSAKELQRQIGVTYKTAWRMAKQIRSLMTDDSDMLSGNVEVDETYIGGRHAHQQGGKGKIPVFGMLERGGNVKTKTLPARETHLILNQIFRSIKAGSHILSDQFGVYKKTAKLGYTHSSVNHWTKQYVKGLTHTNSIEGFWSQLKRSLDGTYHAVSAKYLQAYVNEFAFRYNHRVSPVFDALLERI